MTHCALLRHDKRLRYCSRRDQAQTRHSTQGDNCCVHPVHRWKCRHWLRPLHKRHPPWRDLLLEMPHDCARLISPEPPDSRPLTPQIHQPKKIHHRYRLQEYLTHPEQSIKMCEKQTNRAKPVEHDQSNDRDVILAFP